ncbi:MAG: xanthine dehydrogenase family protein subunit M [Acidobacteria bacterium]|nr:xanthine dehydrogenase family protein subunit M [Acidobacteriota bacterium]
MTTVYSVEQLNEAYKILAEQPVKVLAGGTDLMVVYGSGGKLPSSLLDIWRLDELRTITEENECLKIGALTTYTQLVNNEQVKKYAPTLVDASLTIGAVQIQNRGTLGGNIVNASPAGDSLPVLSAFNAKIEIGSIRGTRQVDFNDFYTGYRQTVLASDELVLNILLPKQKEQETAKFYKVGTRAAQAISKVVMSVRATVENKRVLSIAIALGSVAPTVIRARETENLLAEKEITPSLLEEARQKLSQEVKPIDDIRSNEHYRRVISGNLIAKFLRDF